MALLFFDGFDAGATDAAWSNALTFTTSGRYRSAMNANMGLDVYRSLKFTPASTVIVGFAFYWTGSPSTNYMRLPSLWGDAGGVMHLNLLHGGGGLFLRRGTTQIATSTVPMAASMWHYIEIKATIADTGGTCVVRQNGQEVINFTGDTRNGGTNTTIDQISIGYYADVGYIDDFYVCDGTGTANNDFLGDNRVETLMPNENGASSQWVGSDGNSIDNYLLVDENPPSSTDYVESSTVGARDFYGTENLFTTTGTVRGVLGTAWAAKADVGDANFRVVLRGADGTIVTGPNRALTTTYQLHSGSVREVQPSGAAWTIADANNTQVGVEVV